MRPDSYLIDDEGEQCPWPYAKWWRHPSRTGSASAFAHVAVNELGFAEFRERPSGVFIRLRTAIASERTLFGVVDAVSRLPTKKKVIEISPDGKCDTIFRTSWKALVELNARLERRQVAEQIFLRRLRNPDDMRASDGLADLMRLAAAGGALVERGRLMQAPRRALRGRFALLQPQPDGETMLIKDWGSAYGSFDERWVRMSKGLIFEDQPDFRYASAAVRGYHQVARLNRPVLDDVDAFIARPGGRARIRYRRLIVPAVTRTGATYLLSTSLEDPAIDLR